MNCLERSIRISEREFPCRFFVPDGEPPVAGWPLLIALHGAGERGSDGVRPSENGLGPFVHTHSDWFPGIIAFPQAPEESWWKGDAADAARGCVDVIWRECPIDRDRLLLVGLSMGGYGVLDLALADPQPYAALVAVCGGIIAPPQFPGMSAALPIEDPYRDTARRLAGLPIRLYHGSDDPIIPVTESRLLFAAFEREGAPVFYREFPGCGHNAWDPAFSDPGLWKWLFAQRRR